jgi:hypothetical protein
MYWDTGIWVAVAIGFSVLSGLEAEGAKRLQF